MGNELVKCIWFDPEVFNNENQSYFNILKKEYDVIRSSNVDDVIDTAKLNFETKYFLISSGSKAKELIPQINSLQNIIDIHIFCQNPSYHQELTKLSKVRSISNRFSQVQEKLKESKTKQYTTIIAKESGMEVLASALNQHAYGTQTQHSEAKGSYTIDTHIGDDARLALIFCYRSIGTSFTVDQILEELVKLNECQAEKIEKILRVQFKGNLFDGIMNLYSRNIIYRELNTACSQIQLTDLQHTMSLLYSEICKKPDLMIHSSKTLYRGVAGHTPYKQCGYWSAFTSTSLSKEFAKSWATVNGTVFEITLDSENPHPNAYIKNISEYENEDEVLLLPFFPLKETSRIIKDGQIWIYIQQDTSRAPISLEPKKTKEFWMSIFQNKILPDINKICTSLVDKITNEFDLFVFMQSKKVLAIIDEILEEAHLQCQGQIDGAASSFINLITAGSNQRRYRNDMVKIFEAKMPEKIRQELIEILEEYLNQLKSQLKNLIVNEIENFYSHIPNVNLEKLINELER